MTITKNVWKAAAFLLILCLVSTVMISGTYAKYTSTYAGEDTALVAKWSVITTGGGIGLTEGSTADLDLFHHAFDTNITTSNGAAYIIAPGVQGHFTVTFENKSDVAADIGFQIATTGSAVNANLPIKYSLTSGGAIRNLSELTSDLDGVFNTVSQGDVVSQDVYWIWPFDGTPSTDTPYGVSSAAIANRTSYGLTITATAVQIAPTE